MAPHTASAAAGINHQINFQGKLVTPTGTNVTDGSYTVVFSLYNVASAGAAIWTETQTVAVSAGIFQVNLGSVTTLPGSIDFNTDNIYLGIKVGADAEMTPRVQFTSVPQAFNAEKLGGLDKTGFIQNTTIQQAASNFNISGAGVVGTSLTAVTSVITPLLQSAAATALTITGNAASTWSTSAGNITLQAGSGTVSLGSTTSLSSSGALTVSGGTTLALTSTGVSAISLDSGTTGAINIGTSANAKIITIGNATGATSVVINAGTGPVSIGSNATSHSTTLGSTTGVSATIIQGGSAGISLSAVSITVTGNLTVAASQYVKLTGDITANRPAAPTAGMVFYDTTTNQLIQWNGTKWVSDHSTSTKIVAASNSTQANKDAADYIAAGTGDQATINTALTAASGGLVYLMEGTYNVAAPGISIPNNTTLAGAGTGTLITIPNAQNGTYGLINNADIVTGTRVNIRDLQIDGNKANQTSGGMAGVRLNGMGSGSGSTAIDGARMTNINAQSIRGIAFEITNSAYNILTNSIAKNNTAVGISIYAAAYNTVSNTVVIDSRYGFYIDTSTNNTISGNTVQSNSLAGISLNNYSVSNAITGNTSQYNGNGIELQDMASNNTVSGNVVQGNTTYGILFFGSVDNTVSGNAIADNGGATTNNGIYLQLSSWNNFITNNDITDTSCSTNCYAINISDAVSIGNHLADNHHSGTAANPSTINDAGTGTIYANQSDGAGNLINKAQGGGLTVGAASATASLTLQGGLVATALPTPAAVTLTTSGTAGAVTYGYRVSALDGVGETLASTQATIATGNATLSVTNKINITWLPIGGAVQYKVFRSSSAGTPATTGLIATVAGNIATMSDTGIAASGAVAAANTTGGASFSGALQGGSFDISTAAALSVGAINATSIALGNVTNNIATTVNGTFLVKPTPTHDSATAFQVQNAAGNTVFGVDTSVGQVLFGKSATLAGKLVVYGATSGSVSLTVQATTITPYTIALPNAAPTIGQCLKAGASTATDLTWGSCGGGGGGVTHTVTLIPEYAGGTLHADGSSNSGTITSDYDGTNRHNYYSWISSLGALNDYDIVARSQIPSEYTSALGGFKIWAYSDSNSTTNNDILVTVRDNSGTACSSSASILPGTAATWTQKTVTLSGCSFAADGIITVDVQVLSKSSNSVRVGEISYTYTN